MHAATGGASLRLVVGLAAVAAVGGLAAAAAAEVVSSPLAGVGFQPVTAMALSADGSLLALTGGESVVRVLDPATGEQVRLLAEASTRSYAAAWSPDGALLATGGEPYTGAASVTVWDRSSWAVGRALSLAGGDRVVDLAFSADGGLLAAAATVFSDDGMVVVWETATWGVVRTIAISNRTPTGLALTPDGASALVGLGSSCRAVLYDLATGAEVLTLVHDASGYAEVNDVAVAPDGGRLLVAGGNSGGSVKLFDATSGALELAISLQGSATTVESVAFAADGRRILGGVASLGTVVWDATSGAELAVLPTPLESTYDSSATPGVAFAEGGASVLSASTTTFSGGVQFQVDRKVTGFRAHALAATLADVAFPGHAETVMDADLSADGALLLTGSNDDTARLWDAATGALLRTLTGHGGDVNAVAVANDGATLATASDDDTTRLWDAATGALLRTLTGHTANVLLVAFSPDGSRVASGGQDTFVRVYAVATGALVFPLDLPGAPWAVEYAPNGQELMVGYGSTLSFRNPSSGAEVRSFAVSGVTTAAYSPDGQRVVVGGSGGASIRSAQTGALIHPLGGSGTVNAVAWSADGATVATGRSDRVAVVWNAASGEAMRVHSHSGVVRPVDLGPGGKLLVGFGRQATLWPAVHDEAPVLEVGSESTLLVGAGGPYVALSPDGRHAFTTDEKSPQVRMWDLASGEVVRRFTNPGTTPAGVAVSPSGATLLVGGEDGVARLYQVADGTPLATFSGHTDAITRVAISPDGATAATASDDASVRLWDLATGTPGPVLGGHYYGAWSLSFSPDGSTLLTASPVAGDMTIQLWDTADGHNLLVVPAVRCDGGAAFSPDGQRILSTDLIGFQWHVVEWDLSGVVQRQVLVGLGVDALAYAPDGRHALLGLNYPGQVNVLDLDTATTVRELPGFLRNVDELALSADGTRLLAASYDDGTALVLQTGLAPPVREPQPILLDQLVAAAAPHLRYVDFRLDLAAGAAANVLVRLSPGPGAGAWRLLGRRAALPTLTLYDWQGVATAAGTVDMVIPAPGPGSLFLTVVYSEYTGGGAAAFQLQATAVDRYLLGVTPGGGGNAGTVTARVSGLGFEPGMAVDLRDGATLLRRFTPSRTETEELVVAMSLVGLAPRLADLVAVWPDLGELALVDAFEVSAGGAGEVALDLLIPDQARPDRSVTMVLEYENVGTVDMPAPLVEIRSVEGLAMRLSPDAPWSREPVRVLAVDRQTPGAAGTLVPGTWHQLPVQLLVEGDAHESFSFEAWLVSGQGAATAVDWPAQEPGFRPEGFPVELWQALWPQFTSAVGATWGQYAATLRAAADHLSAVGQLEHRPAALLGVVWNQLLGVNPLASLEAAVDAYRDAPGFGLSFVRTYPAKSQARFCLGPFGYGWASYYDVWAEAYEGDVVGIASGCGSTRLFKRNASGAYRGSPGETGLLRWTAAGLTLTEADGTVLGFDLDGRLASINDRLGNQLALGYSGGLLTSVDHSSGEWLELAYNGDGYVEAITEPGPRQTLFSYVDDHLESVTTPGGVTTGYSYAPSTGSATDHALVGVAHPNGNHTTFSYDGLGRLVGIQQEGGVDPVSFAYDTLGQTTVGNADGPLATVLWDHLGRPVGGVNPAGGSLAMLYDDLGRVRRVVGPELETTDLLYGPLGNLVASTDTLGHTYTQGYAYPAAGGSTLESVTDQLGNRTTFASDAEGRPTSFVYPDWSHEDFVLDAAGNPTRHTTRGGHVVDFVVNARGQVTEKVVGGVTTAYAYDPLGRMTGASDPSGAVTLTWDDRDLLTRVDYPGGRSVEYEYNDARQLTLRRAAGTEEHYGYDAAGRLATVSDGATVTWATYTYGSDGLLAREDRANGTATTYEYNPDGTPATVAHWQGAAEVVRYQTSYDRSGYPTSVTTTPPGTATTFAHDALGQLVAVTYPDGSSTTWEYDAAGNRTRETTDGAATDYGLNALNQVETAAAATFSWDDDGNLASVVDGAATTTYTWDGEGRLTGVDHPTLGSFTYTYNSLGQRATMTHDGQTTSFLVDAGGLVAEYDGGGSLRARYLLGFGPVARVDQALGIGYLGFDGGGTTRLVTDASGATIATSDWSPFGVPRGATGSFPNPLGFGGRHGMVSFGDGLVATVRRPYHPGLGRFLAVEPLRYGRGPNLYAYCRSSPLAFVDPKGFNESLQKNAPEYLLNVVGLGPLLGAKGPIFDSAIPGAKAAVNQGKQATGATKGDPYGFFLAYFSSALAGFQATYGNVPLAFAGTTSTVSGVLWPVKIAQVFAPIYRDVYIEGLRPGGDRWYDPVPPNAYKVWGHLYPDGKIPPELLDLWREFHGKPEIILPLDPNEKTAPAGQGELHLVPGDEALAYTVHFENLPTASAPAQEVVVTDLLDPDLDWATLRFTDIAWGAETVDVANAGPVFAARVTVPDYRPDDARQWWVDVSAALSSSGEVRWTFRTLDPATGELPEDPEAGFLPPNDASGRGEGHVSFVVSPAPGLAGGTRITNEATIVFDTNAGLTTNQVLNTISYGACDPHLDGALDAADLAELAATLADPTFVPSGPTDCNGDGETTAGDLDLLLGGVL